MGSIPNEAIQNNKEEILKLIKDNVKREGVDELINWLSSRDYFTAPASTRYHLACKGGLAQHSLNVLRRLIREIQEEYTSVEESPYTLETLIIVGLMHDICKVEFYKETTRNQKDEETGIWEKVPYYTIENKLPIAHSAKSQYILRSFINLTRDESMAILSHMGPWDSTVKGGDPAVGQALEEYPLALLLHTADMKATNLDEGYYDKGGELVDKNKQQKKQ